MKAKITLKDSFIKRRLSGNPDVRAEVELSTGKRYDLYFILGKGIIEITYINEREEKGLSEEERICIIEQILENYTSFLNSIYHASISYCLEQYRLADSTNLSREVNLEEFVSKNTILDEFLKSEYLRNTKNDVLKIVKEFYDYIKKNRENIGKEDLIFKTNKKLKRIERSDIKYYINTMFYNTPVEVSIPKGEDYILIKAKELD